MGGMASLEEKYKSEQITKVTKKATKRAKRQNGWYDLLRKNQNIKVSK